LRALLYVKAHRIYFLGFPIILKKYSCITENKGRQDISTKENTHKVGNTFFETSFFHGCKVMMKEHALQLLSKKSYKVFPTQLWMN
jgi:hypothetical protein